MWGMCSRRALVMNAKTHDVYFMQPSNAHSIFIPAMLIQLFSRCTRFFLYNIIIMQGHIRSYLLHVSQAVQKYFNNEIFTIYGTFKPLQICYIAVMFCTQLDSHDWGSYQALQPISQISLRPHPRTQIEGCGLHAHTKLVLQTAKTRPTVQCNASRYVHIYLIEKEAPILIGLFMAFSRYRMAATVIQLITSLTLILVDISYYLSKSVGMA